MISIVSETVVRSMVLIMLVAMRSVAVSVSEMAVLSIVKSVVGVMSKTMSLTEVSIVPKAEVRVVMIIMPMAMFVSMVAIMAIVIPTEGKFVWIMAIVTIILMA